VTMVVQPSPWVSAYLPSVNGDVPCTVLDLACGAGRHIDLAVARGYRVWGVDRDLALLERFQGRSGVELLAADLEADGLWPLAGLTYDVVIVANYLYRPRLPEVVACVAPHGMLIYETFARGQAALGRPSRPDFLLEPGELLGVIAGRLTPFAFQHGLLSNPARIVERLVAVGHQHPWLSQEAGAPPPHIWEGH
jgi:SAM-dependent methyltransferase